jgi:hypothetical protein
LYPSGQAFASKDLVSRHIYCFDWEKFMLGKVYVWAVAMKRFWLILAAMVGLAASAMPASAAVVYTLNCTTVACTGGGFGNYGTVTLTQSGAVGAEKVNVSVSLASGYTFSGSNNTLTLLYNGATNSTLSMSAFTSGFGATASGANGSRIASPFSFDISGFCISGCFDYGTQRSNSTGTPSAFSFDVTKTGGLTLANFTDNDGGGFFFAARIKTSSSGLFWAAAKGIPEPATWALFFAAMAGLTVLYRRRKLAIA